MQHGMARRASEGAGLRAGAAARWLARLHSCTASSTCSEGKCRFLHHSFASPDNKNLLPHEAHWKFAPLQCSESGECPRAPSHHVQQVATHAPALDHRVVEDGDIVLQLRLQAIYAMCAL